jgi:glutamate-ammonia-ligase adenylyltransferase
VLGLLQAVLRRTSYLALLDEQPAALARLVDVLARSALLAERLAAHPLLLDELLDTRVAGRCPTASACMPPSPRSGRARMSRPRCARSTKRAWR